MARTRSQSTKVNIPIVKLEDDNHHDYTLEAIKQQQQQQQPPLKKLKLGSYSNYTTSMIKRKINSLRPSYNSPKCKTKTSVNTKIENISNSVTSNLQNVDFLQQQVETIHKFQILQNFNIDLKTIKILTSNLDEYNGHDLKLIETLQTDDQDMTKFYEFYDIKPPILEPEQHISTTEQQDDIPFL